MPDEITPETPQTPAEPAEETPAGAPAAEPASTPPAADLDDDQDPPGAEALGDPGKRALDDMKARWRTERDARRKLEKDLEAAKAPKDPASSDQPDADTIRAQARAEVKREYAVQLEAKGRLADPSVVKRYPEYFADLSADDPAAVKAAVDELLEDNPYLAATGRPRFQGRADGGAVRKPAGPAQLTRADLKGKSPEYIAKAKREGRLNTVLGINT